MICHSRTVLASLLVMALATPAFCAAPKAEKRSEWDLLRDAYKTLAMAKKDYHGHRTKALRSIEAACNGLGHDVRGEHHKGESQDVSDAQMRAARSEVEQARTIVSNNHQPKIARELDNALKEIDLALEVK